MNVTLQKDDVRCLVWLRDGVLWLKELAISNHTLLREPAQLAALVVDDQEVPITEANVDVPSMLEMTWVHDTRTTLTLSLDATTLHFRVVHDATPQTQRLRLPFLAHVSFGDRFDPASLTAAHGEPFFRNVDWPLPVVWQRGDQTLSLICATPHMKPLNSLWNKGLPLEETECCVELTGASGNWATAFDQYRQRVRQQFDLSQYQRPESAWYQNQLVQHFTFLYGREILNLETGEFELDRFLDEAERDFGVYDGMLVWVVYPRIGIDERTQWEFYDDLPGGRAGLQAMAQRARERGVRFFVPYKPWDRSADLHHRPGEPDDKELARLVSDVEADGIFLDTMSAISPEFRAALDAYSRSVVFCSEGRAKGQAFEMITGAWDQSPYREANRGNWSPSPERMPSIELWRFLFPEHRLFVINRHSMGDDRIRIIQRGFFNGMGWVVWQDIFGLALPYTPPEAALLKKCRTIARAQIDALNGHPTPLVETLLPGVYANWFTCSNKQYWTLYNATDAAIDAPVLFVGQDHGWQYEDAWNNHVITPNSDGQLRLRIDAHGLGAVVGLWNQGTKVP